MRGHEVDVVPSTSILLFPDLMTRDELVAVLKHKFRRIGVNTSKIVKLTNDELLEQFKKFAMPKPQRENSKTVCSEVNSIKGRQTTAYGKRCNTSNIERHPAVKNSRKYSPIRFP